MRIVNPSTARCRRRAGVTRWRRRRTMAKNAAKILGIDIGVTDSGRAYYYAGGPASGSGSRRRISGTRRPSPRSARRMSRALVRWHVGARDEPRARARVGLDDRSVGRTGPGSTPGSASRLSVPRGGQHDHQDHQLRRSRPRPLRRRRPSVVSSHRSAGRALRAAGWILSRASARRPAIAGSARTSRSTRVPEHPPKTGPARRPRPPRPDAMEGDGWRIWRNRGARSKTESRTRVGPQGREWRRRGRTAKRPGGSISKRTALLRRGGGDPRP